MRGGLGLRKPVAGDRQAVEADALGRSRRLIVAGAVAVLVLAVGLVVAAYDAASQIDRSAIAVERIRAERAMATLAVDGQAPTADRLAAIAADFSLAGARIAAAPDLGKEQAAVALPGGVAGQELYFAWTPRRFGTEAFWALAPRRILLAGLMLVVVGYILFFLSRTARDLDRHRRAARELASRDMLTGLHNRLYFEETLRRDFQAAGQPFALFYLDLDGFKTINDTLGHGAGDALLRSIGERLTSLADPDDLVARLGGDEFAIVRRTGLSRDDLAAFARSAILDICRPHALGGEELSVGVSIGIAVGSGDAQSIGDLLFRADKALYQAKAQPGPTFAFAAPSAERPAARPAQAGTAA